MARAVPPVSFSCCQLRSWPQGKEEDAGKPLETMGRKARGYGAGYPCYVRSAAFGKPSETVGRQNQRLRRDLRYARSVTGYLCVRCTAKKGRVL